MTVLRRFVVSTLFQQISKRVLSAEAATAIQPTNTAVKTLNEPTHQTKEDIGKLYTMPDDFRKKLYPPYDLPLFFERLCDTFNETNIVVRPPALELIDYLKRADYNNPVIRYVLYGRFGCGKTITLSHVLNYAFNNNFIVVHVNSASRWLHWPKEISSANREPGLIDLPVDAALWLKTFDNINSELIKNLDLRVSKTYTWNQREDTPEGSPIGEMVSFGINRVKYACQVIDAVLNELKLHSSNKRCKTFVSIDGFNAFFQERTRHFTPEKVRVVAANVSLVRSFISMVKNDWTNGAVVLIVDPLSCIQGVYKTHYPVDLLQKVGVETIDPFIPINVTEYSALEFNNYLNYLEEMRWLQNPDGRDEIEFVTLRNPRKVTTYCATR